MHISVENQVVWARDPSEGYVSAKIGELLSDGAEIVPLDVKKSKRILSFDDIFPAAVDQSYDVDDNCELMYLNEATLLNNIRVRYAKEKIYTYVANILIAVNPYKEIDGLYTSQTIRNYQGKSLGEMPPHVFAIADKSFRDMKVFKQSQSIIVSGESGAGKTESTKYLLRYLCELWGSKAGPIEQKILDANPILEAFGNAKTTRNYNSSRFGKFMEIHFDNKYQVVGGYISHYLLEKSRICSQSTEERSYHVFYLLATGAPEKIKVPLCIGRLEDFNYIKNGCTQYFINTTLTKRQSINNKYVNMDKVLKNNLLDDIEDFAVLDKALSRLGLDESGRFAIYATVAAVLHLGNICFEDNPDDTRGGCRVAKSAEKSLNMAAKLLGIEAFDLHQALVSRVMQSNRGGFKGTIIMVPLKVYEAVSARDALAKAVYSRLFDHIVLMINKSIPFQASSYYIGVLDIAGFEYFTMNSFEQFCINYCNEKLQQFFNERILKFEQELYKREGLSVPEIKFVDNQDCIDLIETKTNGIFTLLDEESKLPKPNFQHFTSEVHSHWPNHFRLSLPRVSKLKTHRSIRDNEGFLIRHFAGAVCYQTKQFIEKNNDALHASLESLIQESSNTLVKSLFSMLNSQKGKLTFISVGSKFKTQLGELMEKLKCNGTNFIRCIKPNNKMIDGQFDGQLCLTQLECSGMKSVLELMAYGYPSRVPFHELYAMYRQYLPSDLLKLEPRLFCEAMLHSLKLRDKDFRFGITRVFFRPGKFAEFDRIMRSDPENLQNIVIIVKKWLVKSRWIKSIFCSLSVIKLKNKILYRRNALIIMQKVVRGYLAKRTHRPRYNGIIKVRGLLQKLQEMESVASQLKKDQNSSRTDVRNLESAILQTVKLIKDNKTITKDIIDVKYSTLFTQTNQLMSALQKKIFEQKNEDEHIRLRKIQEQIEREKRLKEHEEQKRFEEEENKKRKIQMENRRKLEDEKCQKYTDENLQTALLIQEQEQLAELRFREQREQERHDHELAVRLAQESNDQLEESPTMLRNGDLVVSSWNLQNNRLNRINNDRNFDNKKYDLSKWKYSELRDTINTSCDIELLEACRHEFHRRLKVYHAWKAKNRKKTLIEDNDRVPYSIMEAATRTPKHTSKTSVTLDENSQRYFRIPFIRPQSNGLHNDSNTNNSNARGWWYAHFDGQYVARQMELHPDKAPILLVAGIDDMQMCELSLDETGLTRKKGAEILESEFNTEWEKFGGPSYKTRFNRGK